MDKTHGGPRYEDPNTDAYQDGAWTIRIPNLKDFEWQQANGYTRYTREQVQASIDSWKAAAADYRAATLEASTLGEYEWQGQRRNYFSDFSVPEELRALSAALVAANEAWTWPAAKRSYTSECYPVAKWAKGTRGITRATKAIRAEVAKLQSVAAR